MVKKITVQDKQDFKKINQAFETMDCETQIFLMGYVHGLREKNNILPLPKKAKK